MFFCVPAYQSTFIGFGFTVLLLVLLKRSSTRIARVVSPFLCLGYMERANNSLSDFSLFGISRISFSFMRKKAQQTFICIKFVREFIINNYYLPTPRLLKGVYNLFKVIRSLLFRSPSWCSWP